MRLTRKARHDEIDESFPLSTLKGFDVVPYGRVKTGDNAVPDSGLDDLLGVWRPLDICDGLEFVVGICESESELKSPVPAKEVEDGMYTHVKITAPFAGLDGITNPFPVPRSCGLLPHLESHTQYNSEMLFQRRISGKFRDSIRPIRFLYSSDEHNPLSFPPVLFACEIDRSPVDGKFCIIG